MNNTLAYAVKLCISVFLIIKYNIDSDYCLCHITIQLHVMIYITILIYCGRREIFTSTVYCHHGNLILQATNNSVVQGKKTTTCSLKHTTIAIMTWLIGYAIIYHNKTIQLPW